MFMIYITYIWIYIHKTLFILMDKYESVCVRLKRSRGNRKQSTVVANSIQCSKKFGNLSQVLIKKFAIAIADNQINSVMLFLLIFEIFIGLVRSALLIVNLF